MIGRKEELKALDWDLSRPESQLVVVYGRRRIGKTYLIREKFSDQFAFYHTGLSPAEKDTEGFDLKREQLRSFCTSLQQYGGEWDTYPADWFDAFDCLKDLLEMQSSSERLVVFRTHLKAFALHYPEVDASVLSGEQCGALQFLGVEIDLVFPTDFSGWNHVIFQTDGIHHLLQVASVRFKMKHPVVVNRHTADLSVEGHTSFLVCV